MQILRKKGLQDWLGLYSCSSCRRYEYIYIYTNISDSVLRRNHAVLQDEVDAELAVDPTHIAITLGFGAIRAAWL